MLTSTGEVRPLEEMETEIIRFAISHYRGQMSEVARRLKIGRSTLYRKLDEAAANDSRRRRRRCELRQSPDCGAERRYPQRLNRPAGRNILNRCLPVTDKRARAWQKRAFRHKTDALKSVCRELPRMALAA